MLCPVAAPPLRFGLSLPNRAVLFGLPVETLLTSAEQADRSGFFDSVWVGDNFLSKPRLEAIVTDAQGCGNIEQFADWSRLAISSSKSRHRPSVAW